MAAIDLFHLTVDMPQVFLLLCKVFLGLLDHTAHYNTGDRQDQQSQQGHGDADAQHHNQDTYNGNYGSDQLVQALI